jgi:hypothetical protein
MSKSTPINQLPNILLNDPQRQVQNSESFQIPQQQAQQSSEDIIQETLNQLNSATSKLQQEQTQSLPPQPMLEPMHYDMQPPQQMVYDPNMYMMPNNQSVINQVSNVPETDIKTKLIKDFAVWNADLQIAIFAAAFFILLSMLPIDKVVYRYVALEKIPYSGVVIKGVLMFALVLVVLKFLKN